MLREVFVDVITPFGATTTKSIQVLSVFSVSWIATTWNLLDACNWKVNLHANVQILVPWFCSDRQYHGERERHIYIYICMYVCIYRYDKIG